MVRPGYKQTEVGEIPEDWDVAQLGKICAKITDGTHDTPKPVKEGIPYLTAIHIKPNCINYDKCYFLPLDVHNEIYKRCNPKKHDVLMVNIGAGVAVTALVDVDYEFSLKNVALLKPNPLKLDGAYLNQYQLYNKENIVASLLSGGAQPFLSLEQISKINLALPPNVDEQKVIAKALSDVDDLIVSFEKLIAKKHDIKTATMQQLLTGKKRLPGFGEGKGYKQTDLGQIPEDWDVVELNSVSTMHGRIGWQGLKQEEFTFNDSQPFLITGMNFKDGKIRWDEVYHIPEDRYGLDKNIQLQDGDVLMTKDGTIGKILFVENIPFPHKASLNSHLLVFRPRGNKYFPKFVYYLLRSKAFLDFVELNKSGSTFFGITQEAVGRFKAALPSYDEQKAIGNLLSDMDEDTESSIICLNKVKNVKQGMMQELLTGRTRLVKAHKLLVEEERVHGT